MTILQRGRPGFDALGFDPAPGQAGKVEQLADRFSTVAEALGDAHESLTNIGRRSGIWQGEAAEAFSETVGELPGYLDKAHRSLTAATDALSDWHADLTTMQRTAEDLERRAKQAADGVERVKDHPDLGLIGRFFSTDADLDEAQRRIEAATGALNKAEDSLEELRDQARRLLEQHARIAEAVAEAIRKAKEIAPEEPGFFEQLGETLGRALDAGIEMISDGLEMLAEAVPEILVNLGDVLGDLSTMLGVVSGVVELIPGVGSLVGTVLDVVGIGLSVGALGLHASGDVLGAEVSPETYALDAGSIAFGVIGAVTPVPGFGLGVAAANIGTQEAANAISPDGVTTTRENLGTYWVPDNLGEGALGIASPVGLAFWNAVDEGVAESQAKE